MREISLDELELLDQLVNEFDRLHLRKAHAYALLKERGHQFPSMDELNTSLEGSLYQIKQPSRTQRYF